jgi:hypothetical protein
MAKCEIDNYPKKVTCPKLDACPFLHYPIIWRKNCVGREISIKNKFLCTSLLPTTLTMSSHHFVKEGQEPALLIIDPIGLPLIESLLEWSPLIIVYEACIEEVLLWGIKVDVVIAENNNMATLKHKLLEQAPVKIFTHDPIEDPLQTVLYFLSGVKQQALTISIYDPYTLFDALLPFTNRFSFSLLSKSQKWTSIASGTHKKWVPKGAELFLHGNLQTLKIEGLEASKQHYKAKIDGIITLENTLPFWVGETL